VATKVEYCDSLGAMSFGLFSVYGDVRLASVGLRSRGVEFVCVAV